MRLSPNFGTSLSVTALVVAKLFFGPAAQAEPHDDSALLNPEGTEHGELLIPERIALDDVDFDGLLAVVDPDAARKSATIADATPEADPGPVSYVVCEANLRDQHEHRSAGGKRSRCRGEVDVGLTAAGDSEE